MKNRTSSCVVVSIDSTNLNNNKYFLGMKNHWKMRENLASRKVLDLEWAWLLSTLFYLEIMHYHYGKFDIISSITASASV